MKKIDSKIGDAFGNRLSASFAGKTQFGKIARGKFSVLTSESNDADGSYIDQWPPGHMSGGQELLSVQGETYTRVYAGGTVTDHKTSEEQLKKFLLKAGGKTRFDQACLLEDGDWVYDYTVIEKDPVTGIIVGKEVISQNSTPKCVHYFIISFVSE